MAWFTGFGQCVGAVDIDNGVNHLLRIRLGLVSSHSERASEHGHYVVD